MKRHTLYIIGILIGCAFSSCRKIEIVVPSEYELVSDGIHPEANPQGMYLVNEGNMGSNKCTLDYLDYVNGYYIRNLYSERNPNVVKELGDVGNDIQISTQRSAFAVLMICRQKLGQLDAICLRKMPCTPVNPPRTARDNFRRPCRKIFFQIRHHEIP